MTDSYGYTCLVCGKAYYNEDETLITVRRTVHAALGVRTTVWSGHVCDKCLCENMGFKLEAEL